MIKMDEGIKNRLKGYISITNTESAYYATKIQSHLKYIQNANISCCDGIGIAILGKLIGYNIPRLHGPDLMLKCCEYGVSKHWKHYFYGGKEGISERLSKNLTRKYPGLICAGTYSPPFRQLSCDEDEAIISMINQSNPDIIWVGLGLLKQERWIKEHLGNLNVSWMIGVGAAFDFHAGSVKRAPLIFRNIGLEWFYRLIFEPRMFKRNINGFAYILNFMYKLIKNKLF